MTNTRSWVGEELIAKANIYTQRQEIYKDNYKRFGPALMNLMGDVHLITADDFNRFGILVQIFAKISRYVQQFEDGGHDDSLDDLSVYAMMLKELDHELKRKQDSNVKFQTLPKELLRP